MSPVDYYKKNEKARKASFMRLEAMRAREMSIVDEKRLAEILAWNTEKGKMPPKRTQRLGDIIIETEPQPTLDDAMRELERIASGIL